MKKLYCCCFLFLASGLSGQGVEVEVVAPPPVVVEPAAGKTRFGTRRTGQPQHVYDGNKIGWALDDSLLVPIRYYKMPGQYTDFMVAQNLDGVWGVIDKRGRTVLPFEYEQGGQLYLWKPSDPACFLSKNGWQQYFDHQGKVLFETHFEGLDLDATNRLNLKHSGWLVVTKTDPALGEISAIADHSGNLLFPFKYYRIAWATPALICVTEGQQGKRGVRDWNDREIVPINYLEIEEPDVNGRLVASLAHDRYGLLDTAGRVLIPFEYGGCSRRHDVNSCYDLKKDRLRGLADQNGRMIVPPDARQRPESVAHHAVRWEHDSVGLRFTKKEQARGLYWIRQTSGNESAVYHTQRGLLFKGPFSNIQILNEEGPVLAYTNNGMQRLYDLQGRDLLGGDFHSIRPNAFRTCIFVYAGNNQVRLHSMDGGRLVDEVFHAPGAAADALSNGFFSLPDQQDRFALFDPFGKRLTEHRFINIQKPESNATAKARQKGTLKAGRTIVARGMAEMPAEQATRYLNIDNTGEIVQ